MLQFDSRNKWEIRAHKSDILDGLQATLSLFLKVLACNMKS